MLRWFVWLLAAHVVASPVEAKPHHKKKASKPAAVTQVHTLERRIAALKAEKRDFQRKLAGADRAIRALGRNNEAINKIALAQLQDKSRLVNASIELRVQLVEVCLRLVDIAESGDKVLRTYPEDDRPAMASLKRAIEDMPGPEKGMAQELFRVLNECAASLNGGSAEATKAAREILQFLRDNPIPALDPPDPPKPKAPKGSRIG